MNDGQKSATAAPQLNDQARKRITNELKKLNQDASFSGSNEMTFSPVEDQLHEWTVVVKGWAHEEASENSKSFAKQLEQTCLEGVEFSVLFPIDYPSSPPFVFVKRPRVTFQFLVGTSGAMCLDVLMAAGWTPATTVGSLMTTIRSVMTDVKLHPNWKRENGSMWVNTKKDALSDFKAVANIHSNWATPEPHIRTKKRDSNGNAK